MSTMTELNPWNLLNTLLDTNNRVFRNVCNRAAGRFPPVNVYLDDNATIIDVELPIRLCKLMPYDADKKAGTRVRTGEKDGKKARISVKSGKAL